MNRRILISLMVVGVVGATAASGTLAYFNDTEAATGNAFAAGALDLQIGWEEHYNAPATEEPPFEQVQEVTDNPGPIFNFSDLKPGDYGEATINLSLQTNPGWVWFRLQKDADSDNGCNEPELVAEPDCGQDGDGELDDHLSYVVWYDDGDNIKQEDEEEIVTTENVCRVDVGMALDNSGSMYYEQYNGHPDMFQAEKDAAVQFVDDSFAGTGGSSSPQIGVVRFGGQQNPVSDLIGMSGDQSAINSNITGMDPVGEDDTGTDLAGGVSSAYQEVSNARAGVPNYVLVFSDGQQSDINGDPVAAAQTAKSSGATVITVAFDPPGNLEQTMEDMASDSQYAYVVEEGDFEDLPDVFSDISGQICSESSIEEVLNDGVRLDGDPSTSEVDPYQPGESHIGFAWNFSEDAGNEVQTDELVYSMDFYTQQSRNNQNPQNPWAGQ